MQQACFSPPVVCSLGETAFFLELASMAIIGVDRRGGFYYLYFPGMAVTIGIRPWYVTHKGLFI